MNPTIIFWINFFKYNMGKRRRKEEWEDELLITCITMGKKKKRGFTWNLKFTIVVSYIIILYFLFLLLHPFQIHPSSTFALHTMKKMNNILCNESNDLFFYPFLYYLILIITTDDEEEDKTTTTIITRISIGALEVYYEWIMHPMHSEILS